jgi:fused signal recognition particle receptor
MADGFFGKIGKGLAATRRALSGGLQRLFSGRSQLDPKTLDRMEEILLGADLGVALTRRFLDEVKAEADRGEGIDAEGIRKRLAASVVAVFQKQGGVAEQSLATKPAITLFVGVNGVGKTTTIGRLAQKRRQEGKTVLLAAADTFRAGAIAQLKIWGERVGAEVIAHKEGSDPAAVVYDAVSAARARKVDHLFIDTAGRLHTHHNLMAELNKIKRVISKAYEHPYERVLVLDATTGQNALSQAQLFHREIGITRLILTKLDGTAKGGIVVSIVEALSVPVTDIGVGEGIDDLIGFDPQRFADALVGEGTFTDPV